MSAIDALLQRADEDGVEISGVAPTVIQGRGIGVVATRDLEKGDVIVTIPIQAIRSLHTIPEDISYKLPKRMTLHGLLAAEIALNRNHMTEWASALPQWSDMEAGMPILWPEALQEVLPPDSKRLVAKQRSRFENDWTMFSRIFSKEPRQSYMHAWLLINTRTFYFETPAMMSLPWLDRLALLPVADLFNHAESGCAVLWSTENYTITADCAYGKGDEVFISYGDHSNGYLLSEYGFLLKDNRFDSICLDDVILPKLSLKQEAELYSHGYSEDLTLQVGSQKTDGVWIGLRLLCCTDAHWQNYIDGEEDEEGTLAKAIKMLPELLEEYISNVKDTLRVIRSLKAGEACQRNTLIERWKQVEAMAKRIIETNQFS